MDCKSKEETIVVAIRQNVIIEKKTTFFSSMLVEDKEIRLKVCSRKYLNLKM